MEITKGNAGSIVGVLVSAPGCPLESAMLVLLPKILNKKIAATCLV